MADNLELMSKIQERFIECRRVASETPDSKLALFLYRFADEVEAEAREADLVRIKAASVGGRFQSPACRAFPSFVSSSWR
jgi:hypothetical protein